MRQTAFVILLMIGATPVSAATTTLPDLRGTVDAWTPAMIAKARHATLNAGYRPTAIEFVQDGNVFLTATRNDQVYGVTLTRSGKLFASNGIPELAASPAG